MVSSKLNSRAAFTVPGAVAAPEAEAGRSGVKELRLPRERAECLIPPAMPGPRATLTLELPKAGRGMLAVRPAAEKAVASAGRPGAEKESGRLLENEADWGRLEGPWGRAPFRLSMQAANDAFDDSALTPAFFLLIAFLGRGTEAVTAEGGNRETLLLVAASSAVGELPAASSCGADSTAVAQPY